MQKLKTAWAALAYGGPMVYQLLLLGIIAMVIIIDGAATYARCLRLPSRQFEVVETYGCSWYHFGRQLKPLRAANVYARFFTVIASHRLQPAWWVESRAGD